MLHVTEAVRNLVERDLAKRKNESVPEKGQASRTEREDSRGE